MNLPACIACVAAAWCLCAPFLLVKVQYALAQAGPEPSHQSKFVDAGGLRLHYLEFGGEGLPLVLIHSEARDAHTYQKFGGRFSDRNRVLAVTRPGYGQSEGRGSGYDVPNQAKSLIDFLDALAIDRAVFAGNASATSELTYLAENQPKRVAVVGSPVPLFTPKVRGVGPGSGSFYDVAPDGRFLINVLVERTSPPATVVLNWQAGLAGAPR